MPLVSIDDNERQTGLAVASCLSSSRAVPVCSAVASDASSLVVPTCISGSTGRPAADVMPRRLNWLLTYTTMNLFANIVYNRRRVLHTFTRHRTKLITPTTSTRDISSVKSPAAVVLSPSVTRFKRNLAKLTLSSFLRYP